MPTPRRSVRQLNELIECPSRALRESQYWTAAVCRRWFGYVDDEAVSDTQATLPLAALGVRLALRTVWRRERRRLRDRSLLAQAYGVLGSTWRAAGKLDLAGRALGRAQEIAAGCRDPNVRSDIHRRQAIFLTFRALREDGTFDAELLERGRERVEAAVRQARDQFSLARAFGARGFIRIRFEDFDGAIRDARRALELLDASLHPQVHASILSILVGALIRGDAAGREEAAEQLQQIRDALPPRSPAIRARLLWAEGLLYFQDRQRKARARRLLDQARRRFLRLEMRAETIAVTADLARLDPCGAVPRLCDELLPLVDSGALRRLVGRLAGAKLGERLALARELRGAVWVGGVLPAAETS